LNTTCLVFSLSLLVVEASGPPSRNRCSSSRSGFLSVSTWDGTLQRSRRVVSPGLVFSPYFGPSASGRRSSNSPFQSRSWFSPYLDQPAVSLLWLPPQVSIPVWVFSLPRSVTVSGDTTLNLFQSRSGFSPYLDQRAGTGLAEDVQVSIPFWVFFLSQLAMNAPAKAFIAFQSRSGFLPVSTTEDYRAAQGHVQLFQSRSGLSPCLDPRIGAIRGTATAGFNPLPDFLPASTAGWGPACDRTQYVSIPLWVFFPTSASVTSLRVDQVNVVSIPFWVFSLLWPLRHR